MLPGHSRLSKLPYTGETPIAGKPFQQDRESSRRKKQQVLGGNQDLLDYPTQKDFKRRQSCSARAASDKLVCHAEATKAASFPAGRKQAKIQLPACILTIKAADLNKSLDAVTAAISAGATGVLLIGDNDTGGAALYEAGVKLKEAIRGRALLLILNRTDIVDAVGASGVALSSDGLPTLVARRMLKETDGVIARLVKNSQDAKTAAAEGANLVLLEDVTGSLQEDAVKAAKTQQGSSGGIPVAVAIPSARDAGRASQAGADGVVLDAASMSLSSAADEVRQVVNAMEGSQQQEASQGFASASAEDRQTGDDLKHFLDAPKEALLETERAFLNKALEFLKEAAPEMEELSLLTDAIKQLDELFLLVVVGEFNSGKSSIINALLGNRYLAEGILPTTNEISVLKYSENGQQESFQNDDGFFTRKLPAELLRDINIVDTPGTNVIVDRQQRLTEEYVPRADLVLFCMSADRPFTESETTFLRYIRQWGKKVVFIVNKVDILETNEEVKEVTQFVGNNATRLLGVDRTQVLAISARRALQAKLAIERSGMAGGILSDADKQALEGDPKWESSRFGELEKFILDYLVGGASAGESVRLKLQSPLYVTDALLEAAAKQLSEDLDAAQQDLEALKSVQDQLATFKAEMERDGKAQQSECKKVIAVATKRAQNLVDSTLQLSNLEGLSAYIFGSRSSSGSLPVSSTFKQEIVGPSSRQLEELVEEHREWLTSNCQRQVSNYRAFTEERAEQLGMSWEQLMGAESASSPGSSSGRGAAEERRSWRESRTLPEEESGKSSYALSKAETSLAVIKAFDPGAGAVVLEEEIRESVINTVGAAFGAAGLGVVSTFVLPNTLEDLLAVAAGGAVGYAALLNLPLKRGDAKEKLTRVATNFAEDLEDKLDKELIEAVERCIQDVRAFTEPLERHNQSIIARIETLQEQESLLMNELSAIQQEAANVE